MMTKKNILNIFILKECLKYLPAINEEILLILISAHVANYVISIWERGGWTEYCDRDYIQTSIVIMGLTRLGYNFTDYLLNYILSTEADTNAN